MNNMKYIKIFESFIDIESEIKEILAHLSDENFEISITRNHKDENESITILIDKIKIHDNQSMSRGMPFKFGDIKNDIEFLISMISDRYNFYSIEVYCKIYGTRIYKSVPAFIKGFPLDSELKYLKIILEK
jgi:hypothetical protein